jgi:3-keto-5-aminohexanoate cleavage enzyme
MRVASQLDVGQRETGITEPDAEMLAKFAGVYRRRLCERRNVMAGRKVIITVAQTGAFHGREANPNIPLTPKEIADSAYECYNAGAAVVHIHARDKDGISTNDPRVYSEIGSSIMAKCNIITQYSTAPANKAGTVAEDGMALLYYKDLVKPDMCSLDCSLIGTSWGDRTFVYEWYRPFLIKYARMMKEMGIKPELECFEPTSVEDVFNVLEPAGVLDGPISLSFVMGMDKISQGSISFSESNLDFMISKLPRDRFVDFSTISIGAKNHVTGMAMTVLKGGGARVGMEDNIYYAPGRLLRSNAEIVERAVRIIHELGMEDATPDEARKILAIKPCT